jgi:hypothetical protein
LQPVLLTMHAALALEHELALEPLDVAPLAALEPPALPELPELLLPLVLPLPPAPAAPVAPLPLAVPLLDPAPPGAPALAPLLTTAPLAPVPVAPLVTVPEALVPPVLAPPVAAPLSELAGLPEPPEPPEALDAPGPCEHAASVKTPIERNEIAPDIRRPMRARCIAAPPRAIVPLLGPEEHRVSV